MDSPTDNTAVLRMKRDFEEFIGKGGSTSRRPWGGQKRSFGESFLENSGNGSKSTPLSQSQSGVTMQQIIEKEDRLKRAELASARSQILSLENKLEEADTGWKRAKIEWEKETQNEREECRHNQDKINSLKEQLRLLAKKEEDTRDELIWYRKTLETTKSAHNKKVIQLQKDNLQLESDLQELQHSSSSAQTELKSNLMRKASELQICQLEVDELKTQLAASVRRCTDANKQIAELRENELKALAAEHKIKDLESQLARVEEDSVLNKAMKTQLSRVQQLERDNKRLLEENTYYKETQENTLLLTEQLEGLKRKFERSEERLADFTRLQTENQELQARLLKWEATNITQLSRVRSPEELTKVVAELQGTNALMLQKQGELQTSLNLARDSVTALEQKNSSLQRELLEEKLQGQQHTDFIKRLRRKLLLVTKERDGYKGIISQYEHEATISPSSVPSTHTQHLEQTVTSYQSQVEKLEAELQQTSQELVQYKTQAQMGDSRIAHLESQHALQERTSRGEVDQKLVKELRSKTAELEKELERALQEKDVLEGRLERHNLQGDYDPTKTKVLHFSMNPVAMAQERRAQEMTVLQNENKRLKQRITLLEEAEGKVEDLTVQVEQKLQQPSTSKEVEEMKGQLASAELKNKRLMEVFKKTSHEFREVVYQLLGYRIDIPCANQYRLMNMYADSPDDYLLFQQSPDVGMQVLSTDYSSTLGDKIEMYLESYNSIPAFLSSITLELHGRQTVLE